VTTFFCPECWREVAPGAATCSACGADLRAIDTSSYAEKLRRALWHREPLTARRAAWILGRKNDPGAVEALAERYAKDCDVYLAIAIAGALVSIGTPASRRALEAMATHDSRPVVRRHVLGLLQQEGESKR
jgi:HEAT repeat protein